MADIFSNLILVLAYITNLLGFGALFWVLVSLWKQLLSPPKACAKCGEILERDKQQILCDKCQDFVGIRQGAMGR